MNNLVMLMGRLTKDPETKTAGSTPVCSFSLAVNRSYAKEPTTDFFNCTAFGKTGENIAKFFHKGDKIQIIGEIRNDNWTDKDGNKRTSTKVIANSFEFCESKGSGSSPAPAPASDDFMQVPDGDEELPFS